MKLKRLSLLPMIVLLFLGCAETEVDNNVRVLVTGNVVDQNNSPIENATIKVVTDADAVGASSVVLAEGVSDAAGNFEMVSLFGSNALFYIEVSNGFDYSQYVYSTSTSEYRPEDLMFNLDGVVLNKLSQFNYNITRQSPTGTTLDFSFSFIDPYCREFFTDGILDTNQSFCFQERQISRTLNDDFPDSSNRNFTTALNENVTFTYSINGGAEQTEVLTVNSEAYVFEFSY